MKEFCGHFMVFMRSFCVFLARNLFADVVSHYLSMKIYQNSTKTWYKNRHYNLKEVYKLHPENLKQPISLYNLTIIMIMRSTEKLKETHKLCWPMKYMLLICQLQNFKSALKSPPLNSPPLNSPPLNSPPMKSPPLNSPPLKRSMLEHPLLNCQ